MLTSRLDTSVRAIQLTDLLTCSEMLRLFIDSPQYKHFLCGITHDSSYARVLNQYSDRLDRITFLKAGSLARELRHLKFGKWSFPSVFRQDHLSPKDVKNVSQTAKSQTSDATSSDGSGKPSSDAANEHYVRRPRPVGRIEMRVNEHGARIDAPRSCPYKTKKALKKRLKSGGIKLCYAYHLSTCFDPHCAYSHSEELSQDETAALLYKVRTMRCPDGSSCHSFDCFKGHVCPYDENCRKGPKCKFATYHGIAKTPSTTIERRSTPVISPLTPLSDA